MRNTTAYWRSPKPPRTQRGLALLSIVVLVALALGASLFTLMRPVSVTRQQQAQTERALALAKEALIAYAAGRLANRPGELPCPDVTNNGQAGTSCNTAATQIGRLPTFTLGIPDLRDGAGEKLWYAVSNNFKNNTAVTPLNSHTPGQLTVTGIAPANNVIAIVFAPGSAITGQIRSAANINAVAHYLEGENANLNTTFTAAAASATFNDRLLAITPDLFFPAVEMSVARQLREFLNIYYVANNHFPPANAYNLATCVPANEGFLPQDLATCGIGGPMLAPPLSHLAANQWFRVLYYAVAPACVAPALNCGGAGGFLTVNGTTGVRAVLISPGAALAGQARPCTSNADCLEPPNSSAYPSFVHNPGASTTNDRVLIVSP
ncbi:MAG: hypothetical protein FJY56_09115 [Betaproteobacteria bacterium]|nr:hypothetical protein [Betaproteobacteria bacterium]